MDLKVKLYLERAENEIILAKANFELSIENKVKTILKVPLSKTFFNDVISEAYYSIFYSAKAYLLSQGIDTKVPDEHKKTYREFKKLIYSNKLDKQLEEIYKIESEKAGILLKIFFNEKRNRGRFVYDINSNANLPFAKQSIENAVKFVSLIKMIIEHES